jgi:hypothetical protein
MFSQNTSGTRSIVYACVKVCLFLPFWIIIGGYKCAIVIANRGEEELGFHFKIIKMHVTWCHVEFTRGSNSTQF